MESNVIFVFYSVKHMCVTMYCMCMCVCIYAYQRRGDPCAAKIFTAAESASRVRVKQNEIDFMRMLNHTNIVRFFAIEEEARCWSTTTTNITTNTTITITTTTITFDEPVCVFMEMTAG